MTVRGTGRPSRPNRRAILSGRRRRATGVAGLGRVLLFLPSDGPPGHTTCKLATLPNRHSRGELGVVEHALESTPPASGERPGEVRRRWEPPRLDFSATRRSSTYRETRLARPVSPLGQAESRRGDDGCSGTGTRPRTACLGVHPRPAVPVG